METAPHPAGAPPSPLPADPRQDRLYLAAALVVLGACLALAATGATGELLTVAATAAIGWIWQIVNYRYGSSQGSKEKTAILTKEKP